MPAGSGTTMLTTHHVDSDDQRFRVATVGTDGVALAFQVADLAQAEAELSQRGIAFGDLPSESPIGRLARFTDPAGHVLLLREPMHEPDVSVRDGAPIPATAALSASRGATSRRSVAWTSRT
jgi:hypothetical protein